LPFVQRPEQQFELVLQSLPAVEHPVVRGWHVPPVQRCPQHSASAVQAAPSETQTAAAQDPPTQRRLQQSVGLAQEVPAATQLPMGDVQVFEAGSQSPEQQVAPEPQGSP
jgi:hypothetical protein